MKQEITCPKCSHTFTLVRSFEGVGDLIERIEKLAKTGGLMLLALTLALSPAQAEPRHKNRNYILRRQEAGQVSGVPTIRRIIGKREIDIYPNGLMFEGDNVVGVERRGK